MTEDQNKHLSIEKLLAERQERLKELACINKTTGIIKECRPLEETLEQIVTIIPDAWQYPDATSASISYGGNIYRSRNFSEGKDRLVQEFETIEGEKGLIEVIYTGNFPKADEGPFLKEERDLVENLANIISGYINSIRGKAMMRSTKEADISSDDLGTESLPDSRQLLQRFISRHNTGRDLYHDLMPFKVKEILLVANLYEAYIIEKEGRFSEYILGEYHQLNLTSMPRITGVSKPSEALNQLKSRHYDLVIIMLGVDKKTPLSLSQRIKNAYPYIPVFLLLNNNLDIAIFEEKPQKLRFIDNLFVWNGDSKIFFAMIKHLEDKINVENDTRIGMVRVILLVEDTAKYYSRFLPLLYQIVLEQTTRLIEDVNTDELYKVLKLRARPKILLVSDYEAAVEIIEKYRENILCVISDVRFPKEGKMCDTAGFELTEYVRKQIESLPVVIQSSDKLNARRAFELNATFVDKNSESLSQDIKSFISHYLGFGNFIYRDKVGRQIAVAQSLREFQTLLGSIPEESIMYHGLKNHFSLWLMARGEIQIAKLISPLKITDFESARKVREYLISIIQKYRNEQDKGRVVQFEESAILDESNIVSMATGALGGKGRGLAFVNTLIYNFDLSDMIPGIRIRTPKTSIIGTDEYDIFLEKNKLHDIIYKEKDYLKVQKAFLKGELSYNLIKRLKILLRLINRPLAVRSSSLFEDSLMQPFSGIFSTYKLPNNHPNAEVRLRQVMDAIKLVFASIFSSNARTYFEAVNYKIEEEKMAIVIQEVVGNEYEQYYYPHISGTAQSHNYYPVAHMKPDEGFAVAAVGLGTYVVEGEKTFRFSPRYPQIEINSPKDLYKSSQTELVAIDLGNSEPNLIEGEDAGLIRLDIDQAEKHGTLVHCASVFDADNERIVPGLDIAGPRLINFANILKYEYIPLASAIATVLDVVREALGSPVEIEFAVDLNRGEDKLPSFYLLQIKPLVGGDDDYIVEPEKLDMDKIILFAEKSMGNGKIENITDVIYADPEAFDHMKTLEMTAEIEKLNARMLKEGRKYILIGPGRWGTRDRFIGIPVAWPQICNAKVIVETSLEDFPLDASLGSHFFHNVTSMNVGYFSVQQGSNTEFINWGIIKKQKIIMKTQYFNHVRFREPLTIVMDGKKRISVISWNNSVK